MISKVNACAVSIFFGGDMCENGNLDELTAGKDPIKVVLISLSTTLFADYSSESSILASY